MWLSATINSSSSHYLPRLCHLIPRTSFTGLCAPHGLCIYYAPEHRAAFDAQFKPKTELRETSINRVKTLYEHINELDAYGKNLSEETDDPRSKQESEKAQELAKNLAKTVTEFIAARADKENPDRLEKLRKEFEQTLNEGYRELKMHRASVNPILTNIAIAATGIGLLLMIGKWLCTSKEQRTFGFFAETQG